MLSRKIKIVVLTFSIIISLVILLLLSFVIKSFANSSNLKEKLANYDVKVETIDTKQQNLSDEIIIDAIDTKQLNKSIIISLNTIKYWLNFTKSILYSFSNWFISVSFLKLIINTFPQCKNNKFIFQFNILKTIVWIMYNRGLYFSDLQWYFKIVSKI